jgi:hypothetical protein
MSSKDSDKIAEIYQTMLNEDMTGGDVYGGDIGGHMGMDALNDARNPFSLGVTTRKGKIAKKKGKKRRKKLS